MASSVASSRSRSPHSTKRYGSEVPRVWTKPLRKLTPQTSLGFSVIEFAEQVLEITLLPWQKWLLVHMLELLPDNSLRFRTVIVLVARQNGKSTLSQVIALWFMYVYGVALVIGTAQDLDVAEEIWQGAVELAEESEDLAPLIERVVKVNGKKALELVRDAALPNGGGQRYKVKAANRRAGRGLSGDLILLDELREHQTWDAWGAITKTTIARAMALILALSNAGDATSVVLRALRQMCLRALVAAGEDDLRAELDEVFERAISDYAEEGVEEAELFANGEDDSVGIFEWSAPPGCDILDRDGWAMANPSLGYTITERAIASAAQTDPEWVFRTECLCQWSDGTLEGPFPPGIWDNSADPPSNEADYPGSRIAEGSKIGACIDVSHDRSHAYVAVAGLRQDGLVHGEVIEARRGTEWVIPYLTEVRAGRPRHEQFDLGVALQANGAPVSSLLDELLAAGIKVIEWKSSDLGRGTGLFYDVVCQDRFRHLRQPALDVAASTAVSKPLGDSWVWDRRKSPTDAAPLVAVTGAVWLVGPKPTTTKTPRIHAWPTDDAEEVPA